MNQGKQMMEHTKINLLPCVKIRHHFVFNFAQTAMIRLLHLQCNVIPEKIPIKSTVRVHSEAAKSQ